MWRAWMAVGVLASLISAVAAVGHYQSTYDTVVLDWVARFNHGLQVFVGAWVIFKWLSGAYVEKAEDHAR